MSANIATIAQMRDRADADRPYLDAITAAYSEWADAEAAADTAARRLQAAQHHHKALAADPAADPRAIESARLWVTVCERAVPAVSPAEQYFPQIAAARSARADAAGGPDNVISHADVDKYLFDLRRQEEHDLMVKRTALRELREDLHAAEAAAARAFAAAETRSAEHITENIELLRTELKVLAACTRFTADRPLHMPDSALTGRDTTAALRAIHDAAAAANRKILWCSPTQEGAEVAKSDGLADSSTTVAHTHEKITQENWALPAGSLLVIDDAAATAPEVLVDLIDHAYNAKAGVILLDTSTETWPPKPSARLMTLLQHDLPWADQFDAAAIFAHERSHVRPPDLDPILVQASRVDPQVMDPQIREALARREKLRQANRYAYKRHLDITAFRSTPVRTIDENLYPDLPGPD
ncbi:TrwC relaxase [Mycobacteroides abscessus subsp. abscessus]|nr:TrwC relaxase [Mycobacteroides abscessus subsp. abscessus]